MRPIRVVYSRLNAHLKNLDVIKCRQKHTYMLLPTYAFQDTHNQSMDPPAVRFPSCACEFLACSVFLVLTRFTVCCLPLPPRSLRILPLCTCCEDVCGFMLVLYVLSYNRFPPFACISIVTLSLCCLLFAYYRRVEPMLDSQ